MRQSAPELSAFYATPLGRAAAEMVVRKLAEAWGPGAGLDLLALGYATPFVGGLARDAARAIAAMPAAQGAQIWPASGANSAVLVEETTLPFTNAFFDRIVAAHALEESDDPLALLREAGRVLAPQGRMIVIAAARRGAWADAEASPFGHGRPFSRRQLEALVRAADLEPIGWTRALYAPPFAWAARWADGFELAGPRLWPPFAGVLLIEAMKQTAALVPRGARARARPVPGLRPAPAARMPAPGGPVRLSQPSAMRGRR